MRGAQDDPEGADQPLPGGVFSGVGRADILELLPVRHRAAGAGRPDGQLQRHQPLPERRGAEPFGNGELPLGVRRRQGADRGTEPGLFCHQRVALAHSGRHWHRQRGAVSALQRRLHHLRQLHRCSTGPSPTRRAPTPPCRPSATGSSGRRPSWWPSASRWAASWRFRSSTC